MATQAINGAQQPSTWNNLVEGGRAGITWIKNGTVRMAGSAGETISKAWNSFKSGISYLGRQLAAWAGVAMSAVRSGWQQLKALPQEGKVLLGLTAAVATIASVLATRSFCAPTAKKETVDTANEAGTTEAGTTETGTTETGTTEAGTTEAGTTEAGTTEAGIPEENSQTQQGSAE